MRSIVYEMSTCLINMFAILASTALEKMNIINKFTNYLLYFDILFCITNELLSYK